MEHRYTVLGTAFSSLLLLSCASGKGTEVIPTPLPSASPAPSTSVPTPTPFSFDVSASASSCDQDDRIELAKRTKIAMVSRRFMTALLELDPAGAFDSFAKEGKASVTREKLVELAGAIRKEFEPKGLLIERTYLFRLKGHTDRVVCAQDFSKPDGWASLKAADAPEQAYVLLSASSRKERIALVVWLVPEDETWKVLGFSINRATSGGMDPLQLWKLGKEEREGGRMFNATLLLVTAAETSERGPYYQMGISQAIRSEQSKLKVPTEISGKPPWSWTGELGSFTILRLGPLVVAGKIVVAIDHDVPSGFSEDEMVQANGKVLADFKKRFPEYSKVFAGTVVRAHAHGSDRGFASVEELPESR